MQELPLLVPGTGLGTQTLLTINQPVTASSMVWRILEWAVAVSTAIPHLYAQFVQSVADAIEYNLEWTAAVCTAVPHLFVQFVLSLDHFLVPSVLPRRDRFDQFNTALS